MAKTNASNSRKRMAGKTWVMPTLVKGTSDDNRSGTKANTGHGQLHTYTNT